MSHRPLRRDEASAYLFDTYGIRRTRATLAKLAVTGGGPRYRKAGHTVLYDIVELDGWANGLMTPAAATTAAHHRWKRDQK